ncbi:MAG: response regulator [Acetanaerobacterium sp.]
MTKAQNIKVILVDDEILARNLLRQCINWAEIGMEIVAEASDADEAMLLVEQHRPDVVFTDISMPVIDGLKLSKIILEHFPDTRIVVVTGFDDFEYAHTSIKMGISDFIVKPINDEDVYKAAVKLRTQIERQRTEAQEYRELRQQLLDNLPYIREKFYNELIRGEAQYTKEKISFLGVPLKGECLQVAAIVCQAPSGRIVDDPTNLLSTMRISNMARDFFKRSIVFLDTMSRIIVINGDEGIDLYEQSEQFDALVRESINCPVCIGLGCIKWDLSSVSISYQEALDALRYKMAAGKDEVVLYSNIHLESRAKSDNLSELYDQIAFCIKSGLESGLEEGVEKCYETIDLTRRNADKSLRMMTMNIISLCHKLLADAGCEAEDIYQEQFGVGSDIIMMDTLVDTKNYAKKILAKTVERISKLNKNTFSNMIGHIRSYVNSNYAQSSLSLTSVAHKFYLNPSYLSRSFKKETGVSFIEYITAVRMEKAQALLLETDKRAFEIAEIVGIPDANYFCSSFKKYSGISVSSFRKSGTTVAVMSLKDCSRVNETS